MLDAVEVLVVAATPFELAWVGAPTATLACGVGPVEAAAATAAEIARSRPDAVLHVGIAGARAAAGIAVGAVVIGSWSVYDDLAAAIPLERVVEAAPELLEAARRALPDAPAVEIATTPASGGRRPTPRWRRWRASACCAPPRWPASRRSSCGAISNMVGEEDRTRWDIPGALAVLGRGGRAVLAALEDLP